MNKKSIITVSSICLIFVIALALINSGIRENDVMNGEPVISSIHASFSIDVNDMRQATGDADYVFVSKVIEQVTTNYKHTVIKESEKGPKEISSPYTVYSIEVVENLKGKLKKNDPFEVEKAGGISKEGDTIYLYEDDDLLEKDNYYILLGYAQPDGSILVSGPKSSILLNVDSKSDIVSSKEFKEYNKAIKNQIKGNRKRFKSIYEE